MAKSCADVGLVNFDESKVETVLVNGMHYRIVPIDSKNKSHLKVVKQIKKMCQDFERKRLEGIWDFNEKLTKKAFRGPRTNVIVSVNKEGKK